MCAPSGLGSRRRSPPRGPVSTPTTRQEPAISASSISLARTRRAPSTLISWRSSRSRRSSTSSGRRSKWRRSSLALRSITPSGADLRDAVDAEERGAAGDRHQHAGDRRVADAAEPHDQVLHLARGARRRRRAAACPRPMRGAGSAAPGWLARSRGPSYADGRKPIAGGVGRPAGSRCGGVYVRVVALPFWLSIAALSVAQGAVVARAARARAPAAAAAARPALGAGPAAVGDRLRAVARAAERASAQGLTYLALVAVPLLAALALGWLAHGARPCAALLVPPLFALAWADRGGLPGEAAALALSGLSCVALGALLAAVTPPRWLAAGIVAMALADTALVVSDLLQRPNNALNAAHPAAGLPRLQSAVFGSAVMGYGDLFVAARARRAAGRGARPPRAAARGARSRALLALCFDLLFFVVDELPATVPVALRA